MRIQCCRACPRKEARSSWVPSLRTASGGAPARTVNLNSSSYKVLSGYPDTSASVPWLWLLWGLLFGSFYVKD